VSGSAEVLTERRGPALWSTIDRPARRKALTGGVLQGLVPRGALREWSLCGEGFDAATALRAGLVNEVVAGEELDAAAKRVAEWIAAGSPVALCSGRWVLRRMEDSAFDDALTFGEAQIGLASLTEDAREGIAAFNEKRRPRWVVE
jgi:methylglutaconyl-CoA hydratase